VLSVFLSGPLSLVFVVIWHFMKRFGDPRPGLQIYSSFPSFLVDFLTFQLICCLFEVTKQWRNYRKRLWWE